MVKIGECRGGPLWPPRDDTAVIPYRIGCGATRCGRPKEGTACRKIGINCVRSLQEMNIFEKMSRIRIYNFEGGG